MFEDIIGHDISTIETPALIVDNQMLNWNLSLLAKQTSAKNVNLRPHAKAHKCIQIALIQMELGAVGICCQTVREAEIFSEAGIKDILLTNQIVDLQKAIRLVRLSKNSTIGVCIDNVQQIDVLKEAIEKSDARINIYIEVNVGGNRCGVDHVEEFNELFSEVEKVNGLRLVGIQAYNGKAQHIKELEKRADAVRKSNTIARDFISIFEERKGVKCNSTGGGTGTVQLDLDYSILTEVQCGSYALMDNDYASIERAQPNHLDFKHSLYIISRVISHRNKSYSVVDAGLKAFSFDSGLPKVLSNSGLRYDNPSDEHGIIHSSDTGKLPKIGDLIKFTPGHCDPTVALHKKIIVVKNNKVVDVWPVVGRGEW